MSCARYRLPAVVLPAAVHPLEEGQAVHRLCERHVKDRPFLTTSSTVTPYSRSLFQMRG